MKKLILLSLIILTPFAASASVKIISVVNGESITNYQLDQRVDIIVSSSGLADDKSARERIRKQALDILINETLQKQEAASLGITLTDAEFASAIKDLEQKNNIKPGGFKEFIQKRGINYDATIDQIKAGLTWKKVIARLIQPRIYVTDDEVAVKAKSYSDKDIKREVEVSEIIIAVDYGDDAGAKAKAADLAKRARNGEDFAELAKKYSVGKTSKNGGYVGVINESALVGPLKSILATAKSNTITEPSKIESFYVVLKVGERRIFDPKNDKEQIRNMVLMDKLEQESKAYVKKLREKAYIDKRN
jgi:peptidyl-prolyl cis-trans isomerase SurA